MSVTTSATEMSVAGTASKVKSNVTVSVCSSEEMELLENWKNGEDAYHLSAVVERLFCLRTSLSPPS